MSAIEVRLPNSSSYAALAACTSGASGATMAGFDCVWARERDVTVGGVPVKLNMDGALGNVGLTLGATGPAGGDEEGTLV